MFEDYIVLVTGAASGIGLSTAKKFIDSGATVIAADIDNDSLILQAHTIGSKYIPYKVDIAQEEEIEALRNHIDKKFGKLNTLINNAAIATIHSPEMCDSKIFESEMNVNLRGPMLMVKYFAPLLRENENSSVVNICSIAAICEVPGHYLYSSAKAALVKYTRDCTLEVSNIRHNCILPGVIDTPILDRAYGEKVASQVREAASSCPVGRLGKPEDIANAILFLSSEMASFINGASLVVDGGIVAAKNSPL